MMPVHGYTERDRDGQTKTERYHRENELIIGKTAQDFVLTINPKLGITILRKMFITLTFCFKLVSCFESREFGEDIRRER